jgi:hypothetical protein
MSLTFLHCSLAVVGEKLGTDPRSDGHRVVDCVGSPSSRV